MVVHAERHQFTTAFHRFPTPNCTIDKSILQITHSLKWKTALKLGKPATENGATIPEGGAHGHESA